MLPVVDEELAGDGDYEGAAVARGLAIPSGNLMLDRLEREARELLDDCLCALCLCTLEGKHRGGTLRGAGRCKLQFQSLDVTFLDSSWWYPRREVRGWRGWRQKLSSNIR